MFKFRISKKLLTTCGMFSIVAVMLFAAVPVKAQTTIIGLNPPIHTAHSIGENFTIDIVASNVQNLWSWKVGISWDRDVLSLIGRPTEGPFLKAVGQTMFLPLPAINGTIKELSSTLLSSASATGSGVLATLIFNVTKEVVESSITLFNTTMLAPIPATGGSHPGIDHQVENATVTLVLGEAPVANAGQDQTINQGTLVVLNGSKTSSSDPNGTYVWSFMDGAPRTQQGVIAYYTFNTPGAYTITLTVQDSHGNSTATTKVTVRDITPPVPKISIVGYTSGQSIPAKQEVTFDGSGSTDLYSAIQNCFWDMGDGSAPVTGETFTYEYSNPGNYTVTLTTVDAAENNATTSTTINVTQASITPTTPTTTVTLSTGLLGILLVLTALAIGGSVFWLRKPRIDIEAEN